MKTIWSAIEGIKDKAQKEAMEVTTRDNDESIADDDSINNTIREKQIENHRKVR